MNITDPNELSLIRAALSLAVLSARDAASAAIAADQLDLAAGYTALEADYRTMRAKASDPVYNDKLDCGHSVLGRGAVHYCGDCLERLVAEKEQALKLVAGRDASISDLCAEVRRLERKIADLAASNQALEEDIFALDFAAMKE